jgi:phosphoribosyl 1,2-cyclic phosphodiesterase
MSLFVASLNSGSNGNCYYVGNQEEAVLIDGGISCREVEKRMKRLGLSIKNVKAVFVSHEHGDHIHGISTLARKHRIPVHITPGTLQYGNLTIREDRVFTIRAHEPACYGNLKVIAFPKFHDAFDPHSFIVSSDSVNVGIFTDIGIACENVIRYFKQCHAAFLEANYDEAMLENGGYPRALKNRISSDKGHLSNKQAMQLFITHRPSFMTHLFLSHLSKHNNTPKIVKEMFFPVAGNTQIIIASRDRESKLFHIRKTNTPMIVAKEYTTLQRQLSLF